MADSGFHTLEREELRSYEPAPAYFVSVDSSFVVFLEETLKDKEFTRVLHDFSGAADVAIEHYTAGHCLPSDSDQG